MFLVLSKVIFCQAEVGKISWNAKKKSQLKIFCMHLNYKIQNHLEVFKLQGGDTTLNTKIEDI